MYTYKKRSVYLLVSTGTKIDMQAYNIFDRENQKQNDKENDSLNIIELQTSSAVVAWCFLITKPT